MDQKIEAKKLQEKLIESVKQLKNSVIKNQEYETAAALREVECILLNEEDMGYWSLKAMNSLMNYIYKHGVGSSAKTPNLNILPLVDWDEVINGLEEIKKDKDE